MLIVQICRDAISHVSDICFCSESFRRLSVLTLLLAKGVPIHPGSKTVPYLKLKNAKTN